MDVPVFSTELGIRLSFFKTLDFRGGWGGFQLPHAPLVRYWTGRLNKVHFHLSLKC
jgi:hypothetical protein